MLAWCSLLMDLLANLGILIARTVYLFYLLLCFWHLPCLFFLFCISFVNQSSYPIPVVSLIALLPSKASIQTYLDPGENVNEWIHYWEE